MRFLNILKKKNHSTIGDRFIVATISIVLVLICIITIYPFWYVAIYSLSEGLAASSVIVKFFPVKPTFSNYLAVLDRKSVV